MNEPASRVAAERDRVLALLNTTGQAFHEDPPAPAVPGDGDRQGWRFRFGGEAIVADVYLCGSLAEISDLIGRLRPASATTSDEFPLVSHNGGLVFAVRYDGSSDDPLASTARDVASALGGEEE